MQYCPKCGTKLTEETKFCPNCGYDLSKETVKTSTASTAQAQQTRPAEEATVKQDKPLTTRDIDWKSKSWKEKRSEQNSVLGWNLLAFFLPIVGFICYFVWRNKKPIRAHWMCVYAWWGVLGNVLYMLTRG